MNSTQLYTLKEYKHKRHLYDSNWSVALILITPTFEHYSIDFRLFSNVSSETLYLG